MTKTSEEWMKMYVRLVAVETSLESILQSVKKVTESLGTEINIVVMKERGKDD